MVFKMYDNDRSGVLTYAEFEQLLQQVCNHASSKRLIYGLIV
jgi:hypothetical protein